MKVQTLFNTMDLPLSRDRPTVFDERNVYRTALRLGMIRQVVAMALCHAVSMRADEPQGFSIASRAATHGSRSFSSAA